MPRSERGSRELLVLAGVVTIVIVASLFLLNMDYKLVPPLVPPEWQPLRLGITALIIIGAVWIMLWILGRVFERIGYARVGSYAHVRSIWKLISYIIWAVVFLVLALGLMGDVTTTALSVGLLGAALAFVLQKPLLNVAGWMFITYHRMVKVGDRVDLGGVKGFVVDIRIMHTELMEIGEWMQGDTYTGRAVLVPNGVVFEGPVYNYTRDSPFIWDEVMNMVTYESDIDAAKNHMKEAASEVAGPMMTRNFEKYRQLLSLQELDADLMQEPDIRMEFSDSGVKLFVLYWCPAEIRRKVKTEIVEKTWRRFMDDPRVSVAYPHVEVVGHKGREQYLPEPPPKKK